MYPILFSLGFLTIYSFGFFVAIALLIGLFLFWRQAQRIEADTQIVFDTAFVTLIGAVFFGRIVFVLMHPLAFWPQIWQVINIFYKSGYVYYGLLFGAIFACTWFTKRHKLPTRIYLDMFAQVIPLVHAIGLLGAFLAGSAYGIRTNWWWGVSMIGLDGRRTPVQLIEGVLELVNYAFLGVLAKRRHKPGSIALWYILIYSIERILIEFLRGDSVYWLMIRSQWILSILAIGSAIFYWYRKGKYLKSSDLIT